MFEINGYEKQETLEKIGFSNLLDILFECSDHFSLNQALWTYATDNTLKNNLAPFLEKKIITSKWFGYDYSQAPHGDYRDIEVYIYRADPVAKDIFVNMFSDIFLRVYQNNDYQDSFQSLEDLCFFKDKKLFIGTVSHALLLGVIPINDAIRDFVIESKGWTSVEDSNIYLSDYNTTNI